MFSAVRRVAAIGFAGAGIALMATTGVAGASTSTAALNAQDRAWLVAAHQSNLTEIQAGQAAQQKATSSVVKEHGALFIRDHTRLDAALSQVAKAAGVTLPSAPNAQQQATLASVAAKSGSAFDSAWLSSQLAGHRQAKAAGQAELANGSDPAVLAAAKSSAPVVQMHLTMLEQATGTAPSGANAGTGGQAATGGGLLTGWFLVGLALVAVAGALALLRRPRRGVTSA
jgi:putative membrane protein